jgi:transglutaminase-like putative cysteine protease
MLFLASLVLSFDTSVENPLTPLYPLAVAAAGIIAFATVDRRPELGLSRELGINLAAASVILSLLEWFVDDKLLILALGHWLIYLELIEMFRAKTVEVDWYLFLLGLVQALIGGFIGQGEWLGLALVAWALTALSALGLFYLRREALRDEPAQGVVVTPRPNRQEPYPGLIDPPFLFSASNVALLTLGLGVGIFLVMPRWSSQARGAGGGAGVTKHLTGFNDEVKLGQMGEILESDDVVMSIELYDESDNRVPPPAGGEPLWRGVAMQTYDNGRWFRQPVFPRNMLRDNFPRITPAKTIRQVVRLEPTDSDVLFGLRPIVLARGHELVMNITDGMIYRSDLHPAAEYIEKTNTRPGPYDYEVLSSNDGDLIQPGEVYPSDSKIRNKLLHVPEPLQTRLWAFVEPILAQLPEDQRSDEDKARKLESFLRDAGGYTYSLRMSVSDPSLDPVEDFLFRRKEGHCAYYASALTLMLRSAGIPARLINGFKGGDWSDLAQVVTVRQKHAHSWVEALIDRRPPARRGESFQPIWITLDPTPARERDATVARVGGFSNRFRSVGDFVRYMWIFYVAGFNSDRQEALIYGPLRSLAIDAVTGFRTMWAVLRRAIGWLFHFPDGYNFFSVKGFLVSVLVMLVLAGVLQAFLWVGRRIARWLRRGRVGDTVGDPGVAIYQRLVQLLAEHGLERPPAETPREFARRARDVLATRSESASALTDVPILIVDAFYRIRFGHLRLDPDVHRRLEARLDALEADLRPRAA